MAKLYYFNNLLNETTTVKDVGYNKIKKYAENDEIQKLLNGEKSSTFLTGEKLNCYKEKIEKNASFYMCSNAVFQIATELADIVENGKDVKNDNSFLNTVRKLVVTTYKNRINTEIKYVEGLVDSLKYSPDMSAEEVEKYLDKMNERENIYQSDFLESIKYINDCQGLNDENDITHYTDMVNNEKDKLQKSVDELKENNKEIFNGEKGDKFLTGEELNVYNREINERGKNHLYANDIYKLSLMLSSDVFSLNKREKREAFCEKLATLLMIANTNRSHNHTAYCIGLLESLKYSPDMSSEEICKTIDTFYTRENEYLEFLNSSINKLSKFQNKKFDNNTEVGIEQ